MKTSKVTPVTIGDVAQAAGVSVSTVSRILNGRPDVAEKTRQRVQRVIDELGFRPHVQARRLRGAGAKNLTIALHYPVDPDNFSPSENALIMFDFIMGISRATEEAGYQFNLITSPVTPEWLLDLYRSSQVDGVVLMQINHHDERVNLLRANGLPFVMIGRCMDNGGVCLIDTDYEQAINTACEHLLALNHRKIGVIDFPAALYQQGYCPAFYSYQGWQHIRQTNSIETVYRQTTINPQAISQAAHDILDTAPDVTALVSVHGEFAAALLQAVTERGLSVPHDISVVIIGNKKQSEAVNPPLTCVELPSEYMGYQAARMLIARLNRETIGEPQQLVRPQLVVRASCGTARTTGPVAVNKVIERR